LTVPLKIVVANIDRAACLKGNTIYVNIKARRYPEFVLRYIIAHELAHTTIKQPLKGIHGDSGR
jgi:predicted metal-dependent hydrolase